MPNPFTRFLSQFNASRDLDRLVDAWDELEQIVIRVYKSGEATDAECETYRAVRAVLLQEYPLWEEALAPYWQHALVAGELATRDPFRRLFSAESATAFVDDWDAMQHLPAAREALNRLILTLSEPG